MQAPGPGNVVVVKYQKQSDITSVHVIGWYENVHIVSTTYRSKNTWHMNNTGS